MISTWYQESLGLVGQAGWSLGKLVSVMALQGLMQRRTVVEPVQQVHQFVEDRRRVQHHTGLEHVVEADPLDEAVALFDAFTETAS